MVSRETCPSTPASGPGSGCVHCPALGGRGGGHVPSPQSGGAPGPAAPVPSSAPRKADPRLLLHQRPQQASHRPGVSPGEHLWVDMAVAGRALPLPHQDLSRPLGHLCVHPESPAPSAMGHCCAHPNPRVGGPTKAQPAMGRGRCPGN